MEWIECSRCAEPFVLHPETLATLRRSSQTFHCPWGHPQHYPLGKSETQKLRDEAERLRRRAERAEQSVEYYAQEAKRNERRAAGYKGQATKLAKRASAGVCPCCNRTFSQLARHMACQHPEYSGEIVDLESARETAV